MKGLGIGFLSILTAVALFFFGTRFTDGPLAIFTGGPFTSGVLESAPEDWSYLKDRDLVEFQTLTPARSRTVWLAVHDSRLFIVGGYMNTGKSNSMLFFHRIANHVSPLSPGTIIVFDIGITKKICQHKPTV